ncbi:PREDICTED: uncharacterized protein LOC105456872 isoform X2 [Wasmannia auropunctata]|uniref:uncharacterized protein LOC105456872 isoform X2 n=1 Tax=Wasmannia auropunctata TaxID=64793 RepID=UPI0005EE4807|nr:PREDICTED: uncharacterized protein LOC105456872 isoform X2 [Wasmannia auropunctata]
METMESGDEDMFAISDEDTPSPARIAPVNPVEEHLLKLLANVEGRIDVATNEIAETKATNARILNALERHALHGKDANSDSDSEFILYIQMYTADGVPVCTSDLKKQQRKRNNCTEKILELTSQWQCVLQDKWIIGAELHNRSCCTLLNPRYYPYVLPMPDEEISGESTFWKLKREHFFHSEKISSIQPGAVVATMVLDLPTFDQVPVVKCWGIISYEIDETQFQIPLPPIQLSIVKTIDSSCMRLLDKSRHSGILALKSTSTVEKIVNVQFSWDDRDDRDDQMSLNKLCRFLTAITFTKVCDNVFLVKEHGSLTYCLVEVQSIDADETNIRIFARSVNQLNIILYLLQDEFPDVSVVEESDDCIEAANALKRELEMIRDKKSIREIQEARVITDLLIP